jgi:ABC-type lipoprotein release transport system permease subunit
VPPNPRDVLVLEQFYKVHRATLLPAVDANLKTLIANARPSLWVINWDAAAGVLGQFIGFFRVALVLIVVVVGMIAMIIMMIGVTIATLQRTQVIGTMRAIGAQREFVLGMVLVETLVLGIVFAAIGIALGAGIVLWLGATGIPAFRDELYFFFSGPKLLPQLTASSVIFAVVMILGASTVSVLVPALIAVRVSPLQAMQASE